MTDRDLLAENGRLRARVKELEAQSQWQPIETAPKDGTPILCFSGYGEYPFIGYFGHVGRYTSSPKMWIGHGYGAMNDVDLIGWQHLPIAQKT